jgi:hypothetical protein
MATQSTVNGALFGGDIQLGPSARINFMPFVGWQ